MIDHFQVITEEVIERSRLFAPFYDFSDADFPVVTALAKNPKFRDVFEDREVFPRFPLSSITEVLPGMGSLNKRGNKLDRNTDSVRWLPLWQGTCEAFGLQMVHELIQADCHWEFSNGWFRSPHTSSRGVSFLEDIYQYF